MSSTNNHDDRIEVLSVPDEPDLPPPPSVAPIHFTPADRPTGLQRNGHPRGHRLVFILKKENLIFLKAIL